MKIHDITQEVFHCNVFPGDTSPSYKQVHKIADGAFCNLSAIEMGVHNGTHLDAPWHFVDAGKKIDEIDLKKCVGPAVVIKWNGDITAKTIKALYENNQDNPAFGRILFKGDCSLTLDGAKELVKNQIQLIGIEPQSIAPIDAPIPIHYELLSNDIIILEGLDLNKVPIVTELLTEIGKIAIGEYFLSAVPLKLGGLDGSPCRAILIDFKP